MCLLTHAALWGHYSNQDTYLSPLVRFVNRILAHFFENFHRVTMSEPPTKRRRTELSLEDQKIMKLIRWKLTHQLPHPIVLRCGYLFRLMSAFVMFAKYLIKLLTKLIIYDDVKPTAFICRFVELIKWKFNIFVYWNTGIHLAHELGKTNTSGGSVWTGLTVHKYSQ